MPHKRVNDEFFYIRRKRVNGVVTSLEQTFIGKFAFVAFKIYTLFRLFVKIVPLFKRFEDMLDLPLSVIGDFRS